MHDVELPDGRILEDWPWVITPDFVLVLAQTEAGDFLVFRQTKYAVQGITLAPVAGYLEAGEQPLQAAQRELLEEMGYQAQDWIDLGSYRMDGNRGSGLGYLYLARRARYVGEFESDDNEEQHLLHFSRAELEAALLTGEFKIASWALVVALGLAYLK
jgi:ADP-ribose pyrophosphatase